MSWNDLRKGRYSAPNNEYFITFTTDQRKPLFEKHELACCFCQLIAVNEYQKKCAWLTWVLMPDHFHGLLRLSDRDHLGQVVKDIKGRSAAAINGLLGKTGACWQPAFYDRALRKEQDRLLTARYIVANPLRAGIVKRAGDYPYWDSVFLS